MCHLVCKKHFSLYFLLSYQNNKISVLNYSVLKEVAVTSYSLKGSPWVWISTDYNTHYESKSKFPLHSLQNICIFRQNYRSEFISKQQYENNCFDVCFFFLIQKEEKRLRFTRCFLITHAHKLTRGLLARQNPFKG